MDGATNIFPTFVDEVDIIQSAIDLACVPGLPEVRSQSCPQTAVETVNPKIPLGAYAHDSPR